MLPAHSGSLFSFLFVCLDSYPIPPARHSTSANCAAVLPLPLPAPPIYLQTAVDLYDLHDCC